VRKKLNALVKAPFGAKPVFKKKTHLFLLLDQSVSVQITPLRIAIALLLVTGIVLLAEVLFLFYRIGIGLAIAGRSAPFESIKPDARLRVLVIGDSTGVGTGSATPSESVAGRIARDFPGTEIVNRARNGARVKDVLVQLVGSGSGEYDMILLQVGGNDILRFTPLDELKVSIAEVLRVASGKARRVIFISTGNVGLAPAFFPPLSWIYTWRTRSVRALFMETARDQNAQYVDLFRERGQDLFLENPAKFYAPDLLHPSGEGYGVWYRELRRQMDLDTVLGSSRAGE
jgi:lysophospholipase L1-like esterase